jgi:hypothetical protein
VNGKSEPAAGQNAAAGDVDDEPALAGADEPLAVRYCGGCNPVIDRVGVAAAAQSCGAGAGATLYVSGCARACASGRRLRLDEGAAVVVAGEHVDGEPTAAPRITQEVKDRLRRSRADSHTGRPRGGAPQPEG